MQPAAAEIARTSAAGRAAEAAGGKNLPQEAQPRQA